MVNEFPIQGAPPGTWYDTLRNYIGDPLRTLSALDDPGVRTKVAGIAGGAVDSVNGYTGAVVLDATDVGALPSTATAPDLGGVAGGAGITAIVKLTAAAYAALASPSASTLYVVVG